MFADKGTVLKVISVPKERWNNMEDLLLEELEVFKVRPLDTTVLTSYDITTLYDPKPSKLCNFALSMHNNRHIITIAVWFSFPLRMPHPSSTCRSPPNAYVYNSISQSTPRWLIPLIDSIESINAGDLTVTPWILWTGPVSLACCHMTAGSVCPTATAVRGLGHGHRPGAPPPLQRLWEGLRRVLPGPGPLLRLGRHLLHALPAQHQEVRVWMS